MRTLYKFLRAGVVSALFVQVGFAQKENVGIGTTKPDQSAILDLSSTNKGLLMPRVTLQQRNSIQNPANGLIVYQTDVLSGFYYYDGKEWKSVGSETAQKSVADAFNWGLTGNAGTNPSTNFIGTTDNQSLQFRVNGNNSGLIGTSTSQNTFLGYLAGRFAPGVENTAMGHYSMFSATSGSYNVAFGSGTLKSASSPGSYNVAIGRNALSNNTADANIAIGSGALEGNTSGFGNFAIGTNALGLNQTGAGSFALGAGALGNFNPAGSSGYNMAIGFNALNSLSSGTYNIAIGTSAGKFLSTTSSNNIAIGSDAGPGTLTNVSNRLFIDNVATLTPLIGADFSLKTVKFHLGTPAANNTAGYFAIGDMTNASLFTFNGTQAGYRLIVQDGILTEKIKVATKGSSDWADYVFEEDYKRMSLEELELFVKANKHLPNVPTTEQMIANGNDIQKTDAKLLEKIEELTLYMIEMNKELKALKAENERLKK